MLITGKDTKDKTAETNIRYLNDRIAKNNLAYHLLKDTFSKLGMKYDLYYIWKIHFIH